jgi:hypothetical protein
MLFCVFVGLALLAYSIARASLTSFNNDESFTYLYHVRAPVIDIVTYDVDFLPSNNHLVNSLLMKLASALFGPSEIVLRAPNILAHVLYIASSLVIVRWYVPIALAPFAFLLLNVNPYLLEFFSLARGYGLALGFMMCSICFCLHFFERRGRFDVFFSSLFGGLAVLSSFSFVSYYVAMCVVILIVACSGQRSANRNPPHYRQRVVAGIREASPLVLNGLILMGVIALPILKVKQFLTNYKESNPLSVGGTTSFWEDTVLSLLRSSLYQQNYGHNVIPALAVFVVIAAFFAAALLVYAIRHWHSDRRLALMLVVVPIPFLVAIGSVLQHHLFGVFYLKDRTAIMFVPFFSLLLIAVASCLTVLGKRSVVKNAGLLLVLVAAVGASVHMVRSFNLSHSLVLRGNASTKQMIHDLRRDRDASGRRVNETRVVLGISPVYKPVVNYYMVSRKLNWLRTADLERLGQNFDYVFYKPEDEPAIRDRQLIRLAVYPITDDVLAKKAPN